MSKPFLLISFFTLTPVVLITSAYILYTQPFSTPPQVLSLSTQNPAVIATSTDPAPSTFASFSVRDARPVIIRRYLHEYDSPLEPHSEYLVEISDKYLLDYRLLVAIAQQESNLCKKIPADSHNCWGFGIYGDKVTRFDNYPQAIETVASTLKKNYIDHGLNTPEEIMAKYTPPSVEKGGPWAKAISQFLSDLQ
ncbi:hypothetical protein A2634_04450 [Candidatus Amesbacteria bacterium RIFCSPHIGHO2_01_FULL_48_32]|uniref:Mannosyl-glycoprotein endo-beta-N-acetylglucosamidase-like domain-containing protein n=1 Tax=Candidatus Amesbacteria bacterium RIFCSPLOWO2_01_FULL_48_25 TaxID=1797259 RepID=A0A1F4ZBP9_9BACT|nr:MAG: hypothetical protein A2634_04450 [Candidatus Amesbacteria bacterium RIFCSPHIGHO2_01_FULL_48_32]OGD03799.1 MAG: hypothetical protein A2989_03920 [Candidatus Amesbacteria bacterium RIFCSPLOWO2_01_FULL_48_25]HJZ05093.1 hypothetical protein [Patescibacteria group bacterium]